MPDYLPLLGVGGGAGVDPDAVTYWGPYAGSLSAGRITLDSQLFTDLKAAGLFQKFDCLWVFAHELQTVAYRNLIKRAHDCTDGVAPTWTQNQGVQGNGTTQYIRTNYIPSTHAVSLSLNDTTVVWYNRTEQIRTEFEVGAFDGTNRFDFGSKIAGNVFAMAINSTLISTQAIAQSVGLLAAARTGAATSNRYRNGISFGVTSTTASSAVVGAEVYICARNSNGVPAVFSSRQLSIVGIGAGLSAAENLALFNIIEPYMDAIGAGVA